MPEHQPSLSVEHPHARHGHVPGADHPELNGIGRSRLNTDLGTDYYERRANTRRQARNHVRGLERLGYKVTIEPIDPATGELQAASS